ncbi:hypothetical protein CYLTODRAFT_460619, partial [Cylindrobasidium torrendii FP15055 ss-10]
CAAEEGVKEGCSYYQRKGGGDDNDDDEDTEQRDGWSITKDHRYASQEAQRRFRLRASKDEGREQKKQKQVQQQKPRWKY